MLRMRTRYKNFAASEKGQLAKLMPALQGSDKASKKYFGWKSGLATQGDQRSAFSPNIKLQAQYQMRAIKSLITYGVQY